MKNPRICVIGAGCSGLAAIKNLVEAGLSEVVCYEQNDQVGGNWIYTAETAHSSVCKTTFLISSKTMSSYPGFPMPDDYPDYPSHGQVLAYFQSYAEHFDLKRYIQFNARVERVTKLADEKWEVQLADGNKQVFDYLLIANGHHSVPNHPEFQKDFTGQYFHAHEFKTNAPFENQRVLVVGAGNSGCDCAVEISRVAEQVDISIRTPQYILPKFFMGKPIDVAAKDLSLVPPFMRAAVQKLIWKIQVGSYDRYGLETPKHRVTEAHPTVNSELLYKIRHGKVHPQKGIKKIEGQTVTFVDGQTATYDVLLAATGYKIITPFFDPDFLDYSEAERVPLYLRVIHPKHPSLFFIGLIQPQGAIWPASDRHARLAAQYITGKWKRPKNIAELAEKDSDHIAQQFLSRKRHTVEVHYEEHIKMLERELKT